MSLLFESLENRGVLSIEALGRSSFAGAIDPDHDSTNTPKQAASLASSGSPARSVDSTWGLLTDRYDDLLRKLAD